MFSRFKGLFEIRCIILFLVLPGVLVFPEASRAGVKNVIIIVADGMGFQQVALLNAYAKYAPNSIYRARGRKTALEAMTEAGVAGFVYHEAADVLVTDSAASATQFSSGKWAGSEMLGVDKDGNPTVTILERAEQLGKSTGLVSDTRITHATPAAFAAHQPHRSMENEIAVDMLNNDVDVMLGGGLRYWIPRSANDRKSEIHRELTKRTQGKVKITSKRKDGRNLLQEAESKGYKTVFTKEQLAGAQGNKVLGLFSPSGMPDGIWQTLNEESPGRTVPNLKEMTAKAIEVLSKNDKGFFLMVEAGQIDWAGHANDAGTMLHELIQFDETLNYVLSWARSRNDTLLIVTADHETGGFGFSYSRANVPEARDFPGDRFKGRKFKPSFNFGNHGILDKIYKQKLSYGRILSRFYQLPKARQTPAAMAEIINANTEFPITEEEGARILKVERNKYYAKGNKYLDQDVFPKIDDFDAFYVYGDMIRTDIIARVVAAQQNVVWSTGTHTNALVPIIAYGPEDVTSWFSRMSHTTEWGQYAMDVLTK
ncbi:MAG: alkaline phosphatase [Deltaproteobacteria bacterium]|nr:alkaline phosphatase [Deltaproteobacteria bacterium]